MDDESKEILRRVDKHIEDSERKWDEHLLKDHKVIDEFRTRTEQSLENGNKAFKDLRESIPTNRTIILLCVSALAAIAAGSFVIAQVLDKKADHEEVKSSIQAHSETAGHPELVGGLKEQAKELGEHRLILNKMSTQMDYISTDLKDLKLEKNDRRAR